VYLLVVIGVFLPGNCGQNRLAGSAIFLCHRVVARPAIGGNSSRERAQSATR